MRWKAAALLVGIALVVAGSVGVVAHRAGVQNDRSHARELAASLAAAQLDAIIAMVETTFLIAASDADVGYLAAILGVPICAAADGLACSPDARRLISDDRDRFADGMLAGAVADGAAASRRSGVPESIVVGADSVSTAGPASAIVVVVDQPDRALVAVIGLGDRRLVPIGTSGPPGQPPATPLATDFGDARWGVEADAVAAEGLTIGGGWLTAVELTAGAACITAAVLGLGRDQRRLRRRATTDSLTGLPNRAEFERRAGRALAQLDRDGRGAWVVVIDLDGFKSINDSGGHAVGDRVLAEAGARLARAVRSSDLVGRWGGDEFVLLLEGITEPNAIGARVAAIAGCLGDVRGDAGRPLTASVGAAGFPAQGRDLAALLELADHAMYEAKVARSVGVTVVR